MDHKGNASDYVKTVRVTSDLDDAEKTEIWKELQSQLSEVVQELKAIRNESEDIEISASQQLKAIRIATEEIKSSASQMGEDVSEFKRCIEGILREVVDIKQKITDLDDAEKTSTWKDFPSQLSKVVQKLKAIRIASDEIKSSASQQLGKGVSEFTAIKHSIQGNLRDFLCDINDFTVGLCSSLLHFYRVAPMAEKAFNSEILAEDFIIEYECAGQVATSVLDPV